MITFIVALSTVMVINFSHIRSLGTAGVLAVDICMSPKVRFLKKKSFIGGLECLQKLR